MRKSWFWLDWIVIAVVVGPAGEVQAKNGNFWRDLAYPGLRQHQAAIARGTRLYQAAISKRVAYRWRGGVQTWTGLAANRERQQLLEGALVEFRAAVSASQTLAEGHYWVGQTLNELERCEAAVVTLDLARRLDPTPERKYRVAAALGIAYTKVGRFTEAVIEYDRAERALTELDAAKSYRYRSAGEFARLHGNAAEALLALGRVEEAIHRYEVSLENVPSYSLSQWGLAVALDRDEQGGRAREVVRRVLERDPQLRSLTAPGVFFIPHGDIHYYFALGYQALGKNDLARREWLAFQKRLPRNPWAERVRSHLAELDQKKEGGRDGASRAPHPRSSATADRELKKADRDLVRRTLSTSQYRLRPCYVNAIRRNAKLTGQLTLEFSIHPSTRRASKVRVLGKSIQSVEMKQCLATAIRGIQFYSLRSKDELKCSVPVAFKPH
jgi:tetratricopeptide (TPR) repeat protein